MSEPRDTSPPIDPGRKLREKIANFKKPVKDIGEIVLDFERFTKELNLERRQYEKGEVILEEGVPNNQLRVILEGEAEMSRTRDDGQRVYVDSVKPGSFIGLLSFWSDAATFTRTRARTPLTCLCLTRERFEELTLEHPRASFALQTLLANSLANRYRHMAMLNIAVHHLTEQLEKDRNELRETVKNLNDTREQLIGKERLALLGKLLAGIAHEINNPSSSLQQSVDDLVTTVPGLFEPGKTLASHQREKTLLDQGLQSQFLGGGAIRGRMQELAQAYPHLDRSLLRRLIPLGKDGIALLHDDLKKAKAPEHRKAIEEKLAFFDIGVNLHSIQLSNQRISKLVQSLKFYSRPPNPNAKSHSAREIILNTLTVLNHRLKHYEVEVDIDALPASAHIAPEINQVLSNIIINACDATPQGGQVRVSAAIEDDGKYVRVRICDTGHGIAPDNLRKIFEPNFTTKSSGGQFGLGLGLAISRDIVERNGGSLEAGNQPDGGACFVLRLPLG